ncbi:MAG: flavodoxin family protein [Firmicutes bacterium]|nr:flavodoxin family protein [Bacillota bacterium]
MRVVLVNGSPHEQGCTYTALTEIANTLEEEGVQAEIFWLGDDPVSGCTACGKCAEIGKCFIDDVVNEFREQAEGADGFIFGTPVHYGAASGSLTSFMDRLFFSVGRSGSDMFYLKPAAGIMSARRAGTTATYDQINKYFGLTEMAIISARYWNMVHGSKPEDVPKDEEGLLNMRILARNMAFFLKCKKAGLENGVALPVAEPRIATNFIR